MFGTIPRNITITLKILCSIGLACAGGLAQPGEAAGYAAALAPGAASEPAAGLQTADNAPEQLRIFAEDAIRKLAQTEPFNAWLGAKTVIEPLGPGTHSWLVTVLPGGSGGDSRLNGYLIISATSDGQYKLVEYGLGAHNVFAPSLLKAALKNSELAAEMTPEQLSQIRVTPLYAGPALAEWMVRLPDDESPRFIHAADGEWLPETADTWDKQAALYQAPRLAAGSGQAELAPGEIHYTASRFNPYDNLLWMTQGPLPVKQETFIRKLQSSKQLIFAASGPERTYSIPMPIYGYQTWQDGASSGTDAAAGGTSLNGPVYVLTGEGPSIRLIALDALLKSQPGKFVAYPG